MNINPDDPRWTAYVLGELSETERARAEQELEASAAAREAVEEIRRGGYAPNGPGPRALHGLRHRPRRSSRPQPALCSSPPMHSCSSHRACSGRPSHRR